MMFKTREEQVEEFKEHLESIFDSALEVDMARAPNVYFMNRLRHELQEQKVLPSFHVVLLKTVKVSLSGLGGDYEPHKEWLDRMAMKMVKTMQRLIQQFIDDGFPFEVIEAQIAGASLGLEG